MPGVHEKVTLPQVFFKHFASKNQLPGLPVSETLVENGLRTIETSLLQGDR